MTQYEIIKNQLLKNPCKWLVTGVAGFIGSNLLEALLCLNQEVVGLDNFITGKKENLNVVQGAVTADQWNRFQFIEGDICDLAVCQRSASGVDYVLHQAALGSVPRSIENPLRTNQINIDGTLNVFVAVRDEKVKRLVYASSSSVYGDHPGLPKVEHSVGTPLSPYAVTKAVNELYAGVFASTYGLELIGLRYFNVFGKRQDPDGPYAAVIPKWISAMIKGEPVVIYGDGETSRDFCFVENVVQANILAATTENREAVNQVYNVAVNQRTTLTELFGILRDVLATSLPQIKDSRPLYEDFRAGDIRHSLADISKAIRLLGYHPQFQIKEGIEKSLGYYLGKCRGKTCSRV